MSRKPARRWKNWEKVYASHYQKIIKVADKIEAGWRAVKVFQTEELSRDSEEKKRINKAQERALKKKKQNAFKIAEKSKNSSSASRVRSGDNRMLFRGMLIALSLCFSVVGMCSHSACLTVCVFLLCVSAMEKENIFPSNEPSISPISR